MFGFALCVGKNMPLQQIFDVKISTFSSDLLLSTSEHLSGLLLSH